MTIRLPIFDGSYGLMLTACGQVKGKGSLKSRGGPDKDTVAKYQTPSGPAFVRAWQKRGAKHHLHVDCALGRMFTRGDRPKVTRKKAEVLKPIVELLGAEIDVAITGHFEVPLLDLPERGIVRSMSTDLKAAKVSMKLTGAVISMSGAPISEVQWRLTGEKANTVLVTLEGQRTVPLDEEYLSESWKWIYEQFSLFMLKRSEDATT